MVEFVREMEIYNIGICAMQEIRWVGDGILTKKNFTILYSGNKGNRHEFGTGFYVNKCLMENIIEFEPINERICRIRLKMEHYNLTLIAVHAPTEDKSDDMKEDFYTRLEGVCDAVPSYDMKMVLGDFNAQIGKEDYLYPTCGKFTAHEKTNNNGGRLVDFANGRDLVVYGTWFPHKKIHQVTWSSPDGRTYNQIDHILVDSRHGTNVCDVRSKRGADIGSDHYMVCARIKIKIKRREKFERKDNVIQKWDMDRFMEKEIKNQFSIELGTRLKDSNMEQNSVDAEWQNIKKCINETAEEVVGKISTVTKKEWFDDECVNALEKKNRAYKQMTSRNTRLSRQEYKDNRKESHRLFRKKKREYFKGKLDNIQTAFNNKDAKNFYREVKCLKESFKPFINLVKDKDGKIVGNKTLVLERWSEFYEQHFKKSSESAKEQETNFDMGVVSVEPYIEPPAYVEIEIALDRMKNGKAPGLDQIPAEFIKYGGEDIKRALHKIINRIWEEERIPHEWEYGVISPIYKKGDCLNCENYRAITLLGTAYKIMSNILYLRMTPYYEEIIGEYQGGFCKGRSTTDQIFTIRQIIEKCWEENITTNHLFIDYKAAYDSIWKEELWKEMHGLGFPLKLVKMCYILNRDVYAVVKRGKSNSKEFKLEKGIRQGDAVAPLLFNIVMEISVRKANIQTKGTIFNKCCQIMAYADDVVISGRRVQDVKEAFEQLEKQTSKFGLVVNEQKTKFMEASRKKDFIQDQKMAFGTFNFEIVNEFVYLGSLLTCNNDLVDEINRRIKSANRAYYALLPLLRSQAVLRASKINIYKSLIRPVLTYGSETWTLNAEIRNKLAVFERKVLRRVLGAVFDGNNWRRRHNNELMKIYNDLDIVAYIKVNRLRWIGHVSRMEKTRKAYQVCYSRPEGKRTRGRPRNRWWDSVQSDIKQSKIKNWTQLVKDRASWKRIIEAAMAHSGL